MKRVKIAGVAIAGIYGASRIREQEQRGEKF